MSIELASVESCLFEYPVVSFIFCDYYLTLFSFHCHLCQPYFSSTNCLDNHCEGTRFRFLHISGIFGPDRRYHIERFTERWIEQLNECIIFPFTLTTYFVFKSKKFDISFHVSYYLKPVPLHASHFILPVPLQNVHLPLPLQIIHFPVPLQ